nr:hypothetical protein GCM10025730_02110 [Promicromonospora thailandica]
MARRRTARRGVRRQHRRAARDRDGRLPQGDPAPGGLPAPGTERISVPYFHGPALDARIPAIELPAELRAQAPGVTRDPANPLHAVFGENWLKSRVRAHPNVVEAQHPHLLQAV